MNTEGLLNEKNPSVLWDESLSLQKRGMTLKLEESRKRQRKQVSLVSRRLLGGLIKVEKREADLDKMAEEPAADVLKRAKLMRMGAQACAVLKAEKDLLSASSRFLRTKAKPPLYWKPKRYSHRVEEALDNQEVEVERTLAGTRARLKELLESTKREEGGDSEEDVISFPEVKAPH